MGHARADRRAAGDHLLRHVTDELSAPAWAAAQVSAVRDDPGARRALLAATYQRPSRRSRRQLPYRRAALSFMDWELRRGILRPVAGPAPGSPWWRSVNDRLLRDGCEAAARVEGRAGAMANNSVRRWQAFIAAPTAARWWLAHNASIVGAYLEHRPLAERETLAERFFMNVVLLRVLYAHALIGAPQLALGRFAPLGRLLGDPRLGMAGVFLSLRRVLPDRYPLTDDDLTPYLASEHRLGRAMDYAVIAPRLQALYAWSAEALDEPGLLGCIEAGRPTYAWPAERSDVWRGDHLSWRGRAIGRALQVPAG